MWCGYANQLTVFRHRIVELLLTDIEIIQDIKRINLNWRFIMNKDQFLKLIDEIFISGAAYGMAHQVKSDAEEYHIIDEETGKILFSDFSDYELAISFYPSAIIPSALKNK